MLILMTLVCAFYIVVSTQLGRFLVVLLKAAQCNLAKEGWITLVLSTMVALIGAILGSFAHLLKLLDASGVGVRFETELVDLGILVSASIVLLGAASFLHFLSKCYGDLVSCECVHSKEYEERHHAS